MIPEFCNEYKTSRSSVYGFLRDKSLKAVKVGRLTRIRRKDAEAWLAALATYKCATPKPKPSSLPMRERKVHPPQDPSDQAALPRPPKPVVKVARRWRPGGPGRPPKDAGPRPNR